MSRSVAAFFAFLLLGAGGLRAQLPNPDPFSPPSRQLVMCQPMPAPADSSVVGFRFMERDSLITRDAILAFKTTGQPLNGAIYVEATGRNDSTNASVARVDYFLGHGMRFENRGDGIDSLLPPQMDENGKPLPRGARPLLAVDMERARTLAQWYWEHGVLRHSRRTGGDRSGLSRTENALMGHLRFNRL